VPTSFLTSKTQPLDAHLGRRVKWAISWPKMRVTSGAETTAAGAWQRRSCQEIVAASGVKGRPGPRGTIALPCPVALDEDLSSASELPDPNREDIQHRRVPRPARGGLGGLVIASDLQTEMLAAAASSARCGIGKSGGGEGRGTGLSAVAARARDSSKNQGLWPDPAG